MLLLTSFVILFGAVVRITGSGAGCGQNWPTCHGEVVHLPETAETAIELTHRVTAAVSFFLVAALTVIVFRRLPRGHAMRRAMGIASACMVVEVLVGALLVRLSLVEQDDSVARALVMSLHLVNTLVLTASLALAAWLATHRPPRRWFPSPRTPWMIVGAIVALLAASMSGAVTALGDTLYPPAPGSVMAHIEAAGSAVAHFLQRARLLHPLIAVLAGTLVVSASANWLRRDRAHQTHLWGRSALVLALVQAGVGTANVLLYAPAWLQVLHLGLAVCLWVATVLLWVAVLATRDPDLIGAPPETP
jgi:cytochrome c oxidase assembly protein subunit 15